MLGCRAYEGQCSAETGDEGRVRPRLCRVLGAAATQTGINTGNPKEEDKSKQMRGVATTMTKRRTRRERRWDRSAAHCALSEAGAELLQPCAAHASDASGHCQLRAEQRSLVDRRDVRVPAPALFGHELAGIAPRCTCLQQRWLTAMCTCSQQRWLTAMCTCLQQR